MKLLLVTLLFSLDSHGTASGHNLLIQSAVNNSPPSGIFLEHETEWPVCLLVEHGVKPGLKEIADSIVRQADRCGLTIRLTSASVTGLPPHSKALEQASRNFCDDRRAFLPEGGKGSIVVVTSNSNAPKELCDTDMADRDSCGQFAEKPNDNTISNMKQAAAYAPPPKRGAATFAVVSSKSKRGSLGVLQSVQQWAMGVGMMGMALGTSGGNGVGEGEDAITGGASPDLAWKGISCSIMRTKGFKNSRHFRSSVEGIENLEKFPVDIKKRVGAGAVKGLAKSSTKGAQGATADGDSGVGGAGAQVSGVASVTGGGRPGDSDDGVDDGKKGAPIALPDSTRRGGKASTTGIYGATPGDTSTDPERGTADELGKSGHDKPAAPVVSPRRSSRGM